MPAKRTRLDGVRLPMSLLRGLSLLLLVACSSSPASTTDDVGVVGDATEEVRTDSGALDTALVDTASRDTDPADTAGYPPGPYGNAVGDTIADLALEGYVRFGETTGLAKDVPYAPTSFADLRAKSPQKWAIVHVSGFT